MINKNAQNCWDYWNCSINDRNKCSAYINNVGQQCWLMAGSYSLDKHCAKLNKELSRCGECDWFKKLNPDIA